MADEPVRDSGDKHHLNDAVMNDKEEDLPQLNNCYLHTVAFQDVGLVWCVADHRSLLLKLIL
jgi:hypothetical protein